MEEVSSAMINFMVEPSQIIEFTAVSETAQPSKSPSMFADESLVENVTSDEKNQMIMFAVILGSMVLVCIILAIAYFKMPGYMHSKKPVTLNGVWLDTFGEEYAIEYPFIHFKGETSKIEVDDEDTVIARLHDNLETGVLNKKWNKIMFDSGLKLTKREPAPAPVQLDELSSIPRNPNFVEFVEVDVTNVRSY